MTEDSDRTPSAAIARLEARVTSDPGAPGYAALAELRRREGRLSDAEQIARDGLAHKPDCPQGRVALSLALLDQNRVAEAQGELERVAGDALAAEGVGLDAAAPAATHEFETVLSEDELDSAFAEAETDRDQVIDADRIAQEAMQHIDGGLAAELSTPGTSFVTHTLADLLEGQGDPEAASRVRAAIEQAPPSARESILETLEGWLENLHRGKR